MISKPRIDHYKSEMEPYFDWQLKQLVWASPCSLRYFNAICDLDPPKENIQVWLIENRNLPPNHAEFIWQIIEFRLYFYINETKRFIESAFGIATSGLTDSLRLYSANSSEERS